MDPSIANVRRQVSLTRELEDEIKKNLAEGNDMLLQIEMKLEDDHARIDEIYNDADNSWNQLEKLTREMIAFITDKHMAMIAVYKETVYILSVRNEEEEELTKREQKSISKLATLSKMTEELDHTQVCAGEVTRANQIAMMLRELVTTTDKLRNAKSELEEEQKSIKESLAKAEQIKKVLNKLCEEMTNKSTSDKLDQDDDENKLDEMKNECMTTVKTLRDLKDDNYATFKRTKENNETNIKNVRAEFDSAMAKVESDLDMALPALEGYDDGLCNEFNQAEKTSKMIKHTLRGFTNLLETLK